MGSLGALLFSSVSPLCGLLYGATYGVVYTLVNLGLTKVWGNSSLENVARQIAAISLAILSAIAICSLVGFSITVSQGVLLAFSLVATTLLISALWASCIACCVPCCIRCCSDSETLF
jgi:hypothetical protein